MLFHEVVHYKSVFSTGTYTSVVQTGPSQSASALDNDQYCVCGGGVVMIVERRPAVIMRTVVYSGITFNVLS